MKEVIKSKGAIAVYDLLVSCAILESATSLKEIDPGDSISWLPDKGFDNETTFLMSDGLFEIPTGDSPHWGGMHMGYVNSKGYGTLEILLDFNDLYVFNYTKQGVQIDYGRAVNYVMNEWLMNTSSILNSSKSLKKKRMEVKKEYKDNTYKNDISFYTE
tara:strand:+ start:7958 stop:8434 length:477 start_codon:yes stop_codon:yes gene_type:complete